MISPHFVLLAFVIQTLGNIDHLKNTLKNKTKPNRITYS